MKIKIILILILLVGFMECFAQSERKHLRAGNKLFENKQYTESEVEYLRALEKDSTSFLAKFNIANALYKQNKFEQAIEMSSEIITDSLNVEHLPSALYNFGNAQFQMKDYDKAIEAYKSSLRLEPNDNATKFNLAYAQFMKQEQEKQDKENEDDKDKDDKEDKENEDKKDNKDDKGDKDNEDKKDDKKDKDKKDDKQDQEKQQGESPQPQMTKQEAEKLLQAIQAQEDKTQEKLKEDKAKAVQVLKNKNW